MSTLNPWFNQHGPNLAALLDTRRDQVCQTVADHFALVFNADIHDLVPSPTDQPRFFQHMIDRFHRLMQVVLLCQSPNVAARELRERAWYPTHRSLTDNERRALVHWYFAAVYHHVKLNPDERAGLHTLETTINALIADTA